jgi:hypothetical protein
MLEDNIISLIYDKTLWWDGICEAIHLMEKVLVIIVNCINSLHSVISKLHFTPNSTSPSSCGSNHFYSTCYRHSKNDTHNPKCVQCRIISTNDFHNPKWAQCRIIFEEIL